MSDMVPVPQNIIGGSRSEREKYLLEVIEDLVWQFAYESKKNGMPAISTGCLSALEEGFRALGWEDPHPTPERCCEYPGCHEHATCGTPAPAPLPSYVRCCGKHFSEINDGDKNK